MGISATEAVAGEAFRCIFCGGDEGPWSIEHVLPAGLGCHADLVLPEGASCRRCNNRLGRQVDEALVHLFEVKFIRGFHRVPDSTGKLIEEIEIQNGTMTFPAEGGVEIMVHRDEHFRPRGKNIQVTVIHNRTKSGDQMRRATRAVLKIGLSLICLQQGAGGALHPDWDPLRAAIDGRPYTGYLLIGEFDIHAVPNLTASILTDIPGTEVAVRLCFGGLDLIADLMPGPAGDELREWAACRRYQVMDIAPRSG